MSGEEDVEALVRLPKDEFLYIMRTRDEALAEVARLSGERERLREACPLCGHKWKQHDPEDGMCDAHSNEDAIGACACGRDLDWTRQKIAALSVAALEAQADSRREVESPDCEPVVTADADAKLVREALDNAAGYYEREAQRNDFYEISVSEAGEALAALDRLVARCEEAERRAQPRMGGGDDYRILAVSEARERMHAAEAETARLREQLEQCHAELSKWSRER